MSRATRQARREARAARDAMLTREDRTAMDGTYRPTWVPATIPPASTPAPDPWASDPDRTTRREAY